MATPDEKWDALFDKLQQHNGGVLLGVFVDYWPTLEDIPCGNDIIGGPVAGLPDNETLSALVADANLTGDGDE